MLSPPCPPPTLCIHRNILCTVVRAGGPRLPPPSLHLRMILHTRFRRSILRVLCPPSPPLHNNFARFSSRSGGSYAGCYHAPTPLRGALSHGGPRHPSYASVDEKKKKSLKMRDETFCPSRPAPQSPAPTFGRAR